MLLVTDLANLEPYIYIYRYIKFWFFLTYILLTIASEIFANLLNVYAFKYEIARNFWYT
jgi:hypothetical protein